MPRFTQSQYLLWMMNTSGMTNHKAKLLLEHFKSAENVFFADKNELSSTGIIKDKTLNDMIANDKTQRVEKQIEHLNNINMKFVTKLDKDYPVLLKEIYDAPFLLYYTGFLPDTKLPNINIIGTRKCTEYGVSVANMLARDLAKCGVTIVSGMARGIDSAAHNGAISSNGLTIAVLGCGADVCYPPENRNLMDSIINNGCAMSEYPPGTKPLPAYFPQRNRIMSGLCYATVIVEAGEKSGASITANLALEQGRDVFAVPGSIFSKQSKGTNAMLQSYAYPVTDYKDILDSLSREISTSLEIKNNMLENNATPKTLLDNNSDENGVYKHINMQPVTIDELVHLTGLPVQNILTILTKLEYKGYIKRLPGQKCIRSI